MQQRWFYQTPIIEAKNQFLKYDVRPQNHLIKCILLGFLWGSRLAGNHVARSDEQKNKKNKWWVTSERNVSKNNAMRISWSVNRFCSFRDKQKTDSYFFKHPPRGAFILLAFVWLSSQYWCMFQFSLQYMLKRHFIYSVYGFISFFASDWYSKLYHLMIKIERRC